MTIPVRRRDGAIGVMFENDEWTLWEGIPGNQGSASSVRFLSRLRGDVDFAVADFLEEEEKTNRYGKEGIRRRVILAVDIDDVVDGATDDDITLWFTQAAGMYFNPASSPFLVRTIRVIDNGMA